MDALDVVIAFLLGSSRWRSWREELAATVALGVFPLAEVTAILVSDLHERPGLALGVLPAAFAAVSYLLARRLGVSGGSAVRIAIFCVLLCALLGMVASFVGALFAGF